MTWTESQLTALRSLEDLEIVAYRDGRTPLRLPIWVVVVDAEVYVRSWRGDSARWYNRVRDSGTGGVLLDGREHPVRFEFPVPDALEQPISAEYLRKYSGFDYAEAMTEPAPAAATLRLVPIDGAD